MTTLAARLRTAGFARTSRSSLINLKHLRELREMFKGDLIAILGNGEQVPVSRRYRTQVMAELGA